MQDNFCVYYYSTLKGIVLTHSGINSENELEYVRVRFERPNEHGFDFAEGKIPHFLFDKSCGFSEDELFHLERYLRNNSALIWEFAGKGGGENA